MARPNRPSSSSFLGAVLRLFPSLEGRPKPPRLLFKPRRRHEVAVISLAHDLPCFMFQVVQLFPSLQPSLLVLLVLPHRCIDSEVLEAGADLLRRIRHRRRVHSHTADFWGELLEARADLVRRGVLIVALNRSNVQILDLDVNLVANRLIRQALKAGTDLIRGIISLSALPGVLVLKVLGDALRRGRGTKGHLLPRHRAGARRRREQKGGMVAGVAKLRFGEQRRQCMANWERGLRPSGRRRRGVE
mmetsp:Transcript_38246/g.109962  ORF Transcript_38246/g.109962 Transcript_38246/m.109962 type:complete len:246 (-) Transcript_38246:138-875(-)